MATGGKAGQTFSEINVTPLTDVFLVLLVIMILIAPIANQAALKIKTPATTKNETAVKTKIISAYVTEDGAVTINDIVVDHPNAKKIMHTIESIKNKSNQRDLPLVLSSDANAIQKNIVSVMDAATGCNIQSMTILPPKTSANHNKNKAR